MIPIDTHIVINPDGSIKSANRALLDLLGYEESELLGQYITILFPQKKGLYFGKTYKDFSRNAIISNGETTYRAKDGRAIPMILSTSVTLDENDRIQEISCVAKDKTEINPTEEQLRLNEAMFESAAHAIVLTNLTGYISWANHSFVALTGYTREELIGQRMSILQSGLQSQGFYQSLWATILSGKSWQGEIINRKKDGSLFPYEQTITPLHNQRGEISRFISIGQDVTERKSKEAALKKTHHALEQLDQMRSNFFADISHELHTPLTVILGEAEVTLRGNDKPVAEYKTTLERIVTLANQINKLVSDLLFLARSEANSLEIVKQPTLLFDILQEVHRQAQVLAMRHGTVADLAAPTEPIFVEGDPNRLQQLFMTLIDNAIKYSIQGGTVAIRVSKSDNDVVVIIADNGLGIPPKDLPHVFERFYRVKRQHKPALHSGSGLGLPIAKWITEAHKGTISIASVEDKGTTVTVQLPLSRADHHSNHLSPDEQELP